MPCRRPAARRSFAIRRLEQKPSALALAHLRKDDILVVWKLDRLGRSLPHLIETVTDLERRKVGLRSLTESIARRGGVGRLIFHVFGALGQFERDLIGERTRAGLSAAAARGRKGGRKPVVTPEKLVRAKALMGQGLNAARLKVGKTALYEALAAHQEPTDHQQEQGKNGLLNRVGRSV